MRTAKLCLFALTPLLGGLPIRQRKLDESGNAFEELVDACITCYGKNGRGPIAPEY
jgi:hypothetical protein